MTLSRDVAVAGEPASHRTGGSWERPLWSTQSNRELVAGAIVAAGVAAVIGLWLADTPAGGLHGLGDELTAAGRVTGLVGTYLLLVEVVLLARIPWLDRFIGMDRLTAWHRRNGEYVIGLLSVHAVAIVAGYALTDHVGVAREVNRVVLHYPDVLSATVSMGLLVGVGVTSARIARSKLNYRTWYFTHLYVYLAAVLGFAHQLATGNELVGHPRGRMFWIALHLTTLALLVGYRVVAPVRSWLRHDLRVAKVTREGTDVTSVHITGQRLAELHAEAGQFFMWRFLTRQGWWQAHPYSLSAAPNGRRLRITVRQVGEHSRSLASLKRGTRVIAEGPYGNVNGRRRTRRKVLLVAGGIGITPARALLEALPAAKGDLTLLYRASADDHVVLRAELDELSRRRGARIVYLVGPREPDPLTADRLRSEVPGLTDHDAFVFGSAGFVEHAVGALQRAGLVRGHIHAERFEL